LEPLLAFLAANRPFAEVNRLARVSKTWRRVLHNALKTAPQIILCKKESDYEFQSAADAAYYGQPRSRARSFAISVNDGVVRRALSRVASENLRLVDLSGCQEISPGGMEKIMKYISKTCSGLKEIDVKGCSNEAVLRAVAIRARAVCGVHSALDLYTHLKSLEVQDWTFSYLSRLLHASTPLLLFDPELAARKNALFQAAAHGTGSDVVMLLILSFAVFDETIPGSWYGDDESFEEGDTRTYDVNAKDSQGNSPLLLACRSGNLEIAEILVVAGANVSAANERGDTPLLVAVGAGRFEMFESLLEANADVKAVRRDGASALALSVFSSNARILSRIPTMIEYDEGAEISYVRRLSLAFLAPDNISRWLKDGRSPRELLGVVCALMASAAAERPMRDRLSHVRAFIHCNIDLLQDPAPLWPLTVTDIVEQLALQESDGVFDADTVPQWTASIERGVVWMNKPRQQHACRWAIQADRVVSSVAYSADGSRLARSEENDVVICDAVSGFEVHRLKGHR
jgi:hypothetical protein